MFGIPSPRIPAWRILNQPRCNVEESYVMTVSPSQTEARHLVHALDNEGKNSHATDAVHKGQKSNFCEHARIVMPCDHFLTCQVFFTL